jgi:hypothetical protein
MRFTNFLPVLVFGVAAAIAQPSFAQEDNAKGSFRCGVDGSTPATFAKNGVKEVVFIRWTQPFSPNSEWTPQRRCEQVSKKFSENVSSGNLGYIVSGFANGESVLCASTSQEGEINCPNSQVLMTLRRGDDSSTFIKKLVQANVEGSSSGIDHNGVLKSNWRNGRRIYSADVYLWIESNTARIPNQPSGRFW